MITEYRNRGVVYYANTKADVHYVPSRRWRDYIRLRNNTPYRCVICDSVSAAYNAVDNGD